MLDHERCDEIASPNIGNFVLSCLIVVGLVVSYLPQHWRIIARRSSEGLSPYFVLLGTTAGTAAVANVLMLPTSRADIGCCKVNSSFSCIAGLLGIAQIGLQASCFYVIMFLFLIFIPRADNEYADRRTTTSSISPRVVEAVIVVGLTFLHFFATFLACVVVLARFPHSLQLFAEIMGVISAVLASMQYIPQIYMTWKMQQVGSLSIPMMCIQTPGGFVFAASLATRLGPSGWSTWATYLVLGTLQGVLLVMAISFEIRDRRARSLAQAKPSAGQGGQADDQDPIADRRISLGSERTPLLHDSGS